MPRVKGTTALTASKMAKRISNRKDNIYDKRIIENILNMYMDEIRTAIINGERVQISKVGTIIPELKVRLHYGLPGCDKEGGNPPYTKIRMSRNHSIKENMDRKLLQNIENNIYGLAKTPFTRQQFSILKKGGYIPEDAELPDEAGIIDDPETEDYEEG